MSDVLGQLVRGLEAPTGAVAAAAGAFVGGAIYISISGVIVGLLVALGLCGLHTLVTGVLGTHAPVSPYAGRAAVAAAPTVVQALAPAAAHSPAVSLNGASQASASGAAVIASTVPAVAAVPAAKIEATETEAQLLAAGRFADYHLAKAKRLLNAGNAREAAHQAAASIAHGGMGEAEEVRKAARAALGGS